MRKRDKIIRITLITICILMGIVGVGLSVFYIWITLFASGWGGNDATLSEVIWHWKGLVLFSVYSFVTSIGLILKKKFGWFFGYSISVVLFVYPLWGLRDVPINNLDALWIVFFCGLPFFIVYGLTILKKSKFQFKTLEYSISSILALLLFLSFYFILD